MRMAKQKVLLDLFCGRWGWSKAFAKRGWKCIGVDLVEPPEIPDECEFVKSDIMEITCPYAGFLWCGAKIGGGWQPDFICASSPCEQFSCLGMKNFQPQAPYPEVGIRLFNHTRKLCEESGVPYIMENVRVAQQFVGKAVHHCGPFYLWGNAVPPLLPTGIKKGLSMKRDRGPDGKRIYAAPADRMWSTKRKKVVAEIPLLLSNCVADYSERILEACDAR